jgi:hypothetical protein
LRTVNFVVVVLVASSSLIFGIVWSVTKGDIQSAFAISSFWLTLGSLLLGYIGDWFPAKWTGRDGEEGALSYIMFVCVIDFLVLHEQCQEHHLVRGMPRIAMEIKWIY